MKLQRSKMTALVVPVLVLLATVVPSTASAAPRPCHGQYSLTSTVVDPTYRLADLNSDANVCVWTAEHGGPKSVVDNVLR
jgi:hypothetical protein